METNSQLVATVKPKSWNRYQKIHYLTISNIKTHLFSSNTQKFHKDHLICCYQSFHAKSGSVFICIQSNQVRLVGDWCLLLMMKVIDSVIVFPPLRRPLDYYTMELSEHAEGLSDL